MTVLTLFVFRFGRMVRRLAGRGAGARGRGAGRGGLGRDERVGVGLAASRRRLLPAIHLARESAFQGPPGHIPVPGGTKLCSPGPFSGANCLIINDGRCQVNFTQARFDSIRPGNLNVLLILPKNPTKIPQPRHLNRDMSQGQRKICPKTTAGSQH